MPLVTPHSLVSTAKLRTSLFSANLRLVSCSFTNQVLAQILLYKAQDEAFTKKYVEFAKTAGKLEVGVYVLPKILDEEVARLHLAAVGARLQVLTPKQEEYLGISASGPYKSDLVSHDLPCNCRLCG